MLIAYVLPGFTALWGASYLAPEVRSWFGQAPAEVPTLGGFLYLTVASIAAGLTISTIRWLLIDTLHHLTGVRQANWDFTRFQEQVVAYNLLTDIHYRYYQFYANGVIALLWVEVARRTSLGWGSGLDRVDAGLLVLIVVFLLGSRDTLRKYYQRTGQLLRMTKRDARGSGR
ncbi:MAG: hypothetical protein L0Y72_13500 [Gemmataceae bacterium]|nr:hypothetical protein [Gemmataceae bacterium]